MKSLKQIQQMVEEMHLQENTLFDVDPNSEAKVTQNVAQFPLHLLIYAPAKFAVATFNNLGGDAFTRNLMEGRTERRTTDQLWQEIL